MPSSTPGAISDDARQAAAFFEAATDGAVAMFSPGSPSPEWALEAFERALQAGDLAFARQKTRPARQLRWKAAKALARRARQWTPEPPDDAWSTAWARAWLSCTADFGVEERALSGAELPLWFFQKTLQLQPLTPEQGRQAAQVLLLNARGEAPFDLAAACLAPGSSLVDPAPDGGPSLAGALLLKNLGWASFRAKALDLWSCGAAVDLPSFRTHFPDKISPATKQAALDASALALNPRADALGAAALPILAGCPPRPAPAPPAAHSRISREDALALMLGARSDSIAWAAQTLPALAGAFPDLLLAALRQAPRATVATRAHALQACLAMARALNDDRQQWPDGCMGPGTREIVAPARLGANPGEAAWACALACGDAPGRPLEAQACRELLDQFRQAGFDVGAGSPSALEKMAKQKTTPAWRAFAQAQTLACAVAEPGAPRAKARL
jgi:hypothetical protein